MFHWAPNQHIRMIFESLKSLNDPKLLNSSVYLYIYTAFLKKKKAYKT